MSDAALSSSRDGSPATGPMGRTRPRSGFWLASDLPVESPIVRCYGTAIDYVNHCVPSLEATVPNHSLFWNLTQRSAARSARVSSWDQTGGNEDAWVILPGQTAVLADLEGPGAITHLWFTQTCRAVGGPAVVAPPDQGVAMLEVHNALGVSWEAMDPDFYRDIVIRIFWDGQDTPSVVAPLGDFFCVGNSIAGDFTSLPFTVSVKPEMRNTFGGPAALNCYLQMPFNEHCRIEVENQGELPYFQYFYVDYELYPERLADDTLYLHSHWRRESCDGWGRDLQVNSPDVRDNNVDGVGNYVVLETEGAGNYVGCNLSVAHFQGSWWGEGDDMIFIDDDTWPPSLHGTGSEDYFGHAWGMQNTSHPMCGTIVHETDLPGFQVSYRWHLVDPVRFSERIKVTIEHGHANHLADDWASTAYWYQTLPSPSLSIPDVAARKPTRPGPLQRLSSTTPVVSESQRALIDAAAMRRQEYAAQRQAWFERRAVASQEFSAANTRHAAALRQRYLRP